MTNMMRTTRTTRVGNRIALSRLIHPISQVTCWTTIELVIEFKLHSNKKSNPNSKSNKKSNPNSKSNKKSNHNTKSNNKSYLNTKSNKKSNAKTKSNKKSNPDTK